jgi:hypothetical protein
MLKLTFSDEPPRRRVSPQANVLLFICLLTRCFNAGFKNLDEALSPNYIIYSINENVACL